MIKTTQSISDLENMMVDKKPFEIILREKNTQLRRYKITNKDKPIKRKLKCKVRAQLRQMLYLHVAPIYIMDEAWILMKNKK